MNELFLGWRDQRKSHGRSPAWYFSHDRTWVAPGRTFQVFQGKSLLPLQHSDMDFFRVYKLLSKSFTSTQPHLTSFIRPLLEKKMATHSCVLAWRIPGTGEPGGLPSMGSHRVGHDWSNLAAAAAAGKGWLWGPWYLVVQWSARKWFILLEAFVQFGDAFGSLLNKAVDWNSL